MKYYEDTKTNEVYGYSEDQQMLIDQAIENGWIDVTSSWPPPPAPATEEQNKAMAMQLLADTDWVNQPDVRNVANDPHLTNGEAFDTYRLAVRQIAVYPVAGDLTWPTKPSEIWA